MSVGASTTAATSMPNAAVAFAGDASARAKTASEAFGRSTSTTIETRTLAGATVTLTLDVSVSSGASATTASTSATYVAGLTLSTLIGEVKAKAIEAEREVESTGSQRPRSGFAPSGSNWQESSTCV